MARATHDYNEENCTCGYDHNSIECIVASALRAIESEDIECENEWEVGLLVAESCKSVGWVRAGDELEDLRQLTMGMTGLDQLEDTVPDKINKTVDVRNAVPMGLAWHEGTLFVGKFDGDPVSTDIDIKYSIQLNRQQRRDLAELMLADNAEDGPE